MYTYETAMACLPATVRQAGPYQIGAIESAFRDLERRGASDDHWQTVIDRINGTAPAPKFDPAFRDRVGDLIDDPDYRARVLTLLS